MAPRIYWSLHLNAYPTMSGRVVNIHPISTFKSQGRTHTTSILNPSMIELTPQFLESPAEFECCVWEKLSTMTLDPYSRNWYAPQISSFAIAAASHFGNAGFQLMAELEFVIDYDDDDLPINGGDIDGHIILDGSDYLDSIPSLHGDDDRVIVMEDEDLGVRPRGLSKSLIEKVRKGRLKGGKGTCPVCLDDFLPKSEMLEMPCSHIFHDQCIVRWLQQNNSCPMCRKVIV